MVANHSGVVRGDDGVRRCFWGASTPDYIAYHDDEWGRPVVDDVRLFEKISLEGFQSGLSWLTILRKREGFRAAFADFDPARVARFRERDVQRLLADAAIVRHRGKIEATIANARAVQDLHAEGTTLDAFVWSFAPPARKRPLGALDQVPAKTDESIALSKALLKRGFKFVGPTTVYAFMQSGGLVDDHVASCFRSARRAR
jgi:DNA-3-methyladenine glycosylase I